MPRNFLTDHFALAFEGHCQDINPLLTPEFEELKRCARCFVVYFQRSTRAGNGPLRSNGLFVALTYLRDCGAILDRAEIRDVAIRNCYRILNSRLERLLAQSCEDENGQLRMLA